jgi:uncharacterized protein DUF4339
MNYHLSQQGRDSGIFPLEELRRRRNAGELAGTEFVWCEGMTQWQPLDAVLHQEISGIAAIPSPPPNAKSKPTRVVVIVAVILCCLAVIGFWAILAIRILPNLRRNWIQAGAGFGGARVSAVALASQPVQSSSNTLTSTKLQEIKKAFRIRQWVKPYEQYGQHDASYDAEAVGLINNWLAYNFGGAIDTNLPSVAELSDRLTANPDCKDPLVLTVAAVNTVELHEAIRRLERAVNGFEQSPYKAYPKWYATVNLAEKLVQSRSKENLSRVPTVEASAKHLLKEAFQDGSILPEDQAEMAEILIWGWGAGFFHRNQAMIISIVKERGESFGWLALVLEGEHQIEAAWRARGDGFVNTVTAEGWKGYSEHLALARQSLTKAWELRPDLAAAPARMIYVAMGDSDLKEMRLWFDRTVAIQIDYGGAWSDMRWGLRPRWHGDQKAMLAFGMAALNTHRFDTDVPRKFFDSVSDLQSEMDLACGQYIYGNSDIWPHLQEMYEGYIAEPSQDTERDGWRSTYAIVAYIAGNYDVARTQLEALHWQPRPKNLLGWDKDLSIMPLEVAARTGAMSNQIDSAESHRDDGDIAVALQLYRDLAAATNADERSAMFVQDRLVTLEKEQSLQTGDWINFLPTQDGLPTWTVERGKCTPLPDGALEVRSDEGGHLLYSRTRVGDNFEVRGTFEVVQSSTKSFQAGLVIGLPQFDSSRWYAFRMKRNPDEGDVISFSHRWTPKQVIRTVTLNSETNSFSFRYQGGVASASVNDTEIFRDAKRPADVCLSTNQFFLGLGAFNDMNDTVIRYRNVQVRKLASQ